MSDTDQDPEISFDPEADADAAFWEKLADLSIPGFEVEFDPDEAERAGAFVEDALSEEDARESAIDLPAALAPGGGEAANDPKSPA